jgi:predicted O-methyltransferase YrrM
MLSLKKIIRQILAKGVAKLPIGVLTDNEFFEIYQSAGAHITPVHFYSPIPNTTEFDLSTWHSSSQLVGVDKNIEGQLNFLREISSLGYLDEYHRLPATTANPSQFSREGGQFGNVDGALLYSIIRKYRPARIIEIGAGASTLLSALALKANGGSGRLTSIEPYPQSYLRELDNPKYELITKKVEQVPLSLFEELKNNDILFIDSSHVIRIGGDVVYEILEILPRLKPGVIIHFHDIFLPKNYPKEWVMRAHTFWTEQYLIQAFLAFNKSFQIIWAFGIMGTEHPDELLSYLPYIDLDIGSGTKSVRPSSLWLKRTE